VALRPARIVTYPQAIAIFSRLILIRQLAQWRSRAIHLSVYVWFAISSCVLNRASPLCFQQIQASIAVHDGLVCHIECAAGRVEVWPYREILLLIWSRCVLVAKPQIKGKVAGRIIAEDEMRRRSGRRVGERRHLSESELRAGCTSTMYIYYADTGSNTATSPASTLTNQCISADAMTLSSLILPAYSVTGIIIN